MNVTTRNCMWCQKRLNVWISCKAISGIIEMCCCTHLALCNDFITFLEWLEVVKTFLALFLHAFRGVLYSVALRTSKTMCKMWIDGNDNNIPWWLKADVSQTRATTDTAARGNILWSCNIQNLTFYIISGLCLSVCLCVPYGRPNRSADRLQTWHGHRGTFCG